MAEHAASMYNRYVSTEDGSTPYQNLHGQRFGTPFRLRPQSSVESDAHIEEHIAPHENADQHHEKDFAEELVQEIFDDKEVKKAGQATAYHYAGH